MNSSKEPLPTIPNSPKIDRTSRLGTIVLIVFVGGFLFWASFFKLESAAVAPGRIIIETNRKTIQHLEGGIVEKINVFEGKRVKAKDVLIQLDQTRPLASLQLIEGQTNMLLAKEAALEATRDNKNKVEFPKRLTDKTSDPSIKQIMDEAAKIFDSRKRTLNEGIQILRNRIDQLKNEIESLRAKVKANAIQLQLIQEELQAWADLEKQSYVDRPKVLALKRESARLEGERDENLALISRAEQRMNETELQISNLAITQESDVLKQLEETQFNLNTNLEKERGARDVYEHTLITAPISGTVLNLKVHTIGGVIGPREPLMDIVPEQERLIVEARVNPNDIDVVRPGLPAKIRFSAYKQRSTPVIDGKVESVSADLLFEEKSNTSYYNARIIVDEKELSRINHVILYPGMPVQVFIVTDTRTPLNYFLRPILDSFARAFREE